MEANIVKAYHLPLALNAGKPAQPGVKNERSNFNERK